MQELSLKSGGGHNFGRGRNLGRVYDIYSYVIIAYSAYNYNSCCNVYILVIFSYS